MSKERDLPKQRVVVVLMFNAERSTVFVLYLSQIFLEQVRTLAKSVSKTDTSC